MLGAPYEEVRDGFKLSVSDTAAATRMILKHPEIFQDYEIIKGKWTMYFLPQPARNLQEGLRNENSRTWGAYKAKCKIVF